MRKVASALLSLVLTGAVLAPAMSSERHRTVNKPYSTTSGYVTDVSEAHITAEGNWATFEPLPGERSVSLSVADATGRTVLVQVFFLQEDAGWAERDARFCGSTDRPLRVKPNETVYVGAFMGECDDGTISFATTGSVTATFSR